VKHAAFVDPGDAATAYADRSSIDARESGDCAVHGVSHAGLAVPGTPTVPNQADVVRRPSGIGDGRGVAATPIHSIGSGRTAAPVLPVRVQGALGELVGAAIEGLPQRCPP
jgi:hypothetical protein